MTTHRSMRFLLLALFIVPILATGLTACHVRQTEEGRLPDVDVDVDAEPGRLPRYEVDPVDVDVRMEERPITVPDIDINRRETTIPVPNVDIIPPEENRNRDLDVNRPAGGDPDTVAGEPEPLQSQ